jgi:hypothetical protein
MWLQRERASTLRIEARAGLLNGCIQDIHAFDPDWKERIRRLKEIHKLKSATLFRSIIGLTAFACMSMADTQVFVNKWTEVLEHICRMGDDLCSRQTAQYFLLHIPI